MIQSAITVSLVPEARGGPFVFWDDLPAACQEAAALGFDAVEIFPPEPDAIDPAELRLLLGDHRLKLAAVGTGAGWVRRRLSLTDADAQTRRQALDFVRRIIDFAGQFGAPAIIGSMQGRWGNDVTLAAARAHLGAALAELAEHARAYGVPLLYEPLNRYETNMCNRLADAAELVRASGATNCKMLADLFHMNIEESDLAVALVDAGPAVGHLHFVDSNRRPAGAGHIDFAPIAAALHRIGFAGYASAEALPLPDPLAAAKLAIAAFKRVFR